MAEAETHSDWEVAPAGAGRSRVTETFDMSTSRTLPLLRLPGYPRGHEKNVSASVSRLADHFASRPDGD